MGLLPHDSPRHCLRFYMPLQRAFTPRHPTPQGALRPFYSMRSGRPPGGPSTSISSAQQHRGLRAPPLSLCQLGRPTPVDRPTPPAPPHQPLRPAVPPPASREAVYNGIRLCLTSMQDVQRRAQSMHRRLHGALQHLDGLDLATREDLREADRLRKVLAAAISFSQPSPYPAAAPGARGGSPKRQGLHGDGCDQHPVERPVPETSQTRATTDPPKSAAISNSAGNVGSNTSVSAAARGSGGGVEADGGLMPLLHRVDAAREQLGAIGSRHEGGAYGPLRRYYFASDEPLTVLAVRSREYCRVLTRAAEEGAAAEGQKPDEELEVGEVRACGQGLLGLGARVYQRSRPHMCSRRVTDWLGERGRGWCDGWRGSRLGRHTCAAFWLHSLVLAPTMRDGLGCWQSWRASGAVHPAGC